MHQERAEAGLVEFLQMHGAHRTAVPRQRLGGGAPLRGDQIAYGFASKIRLACAFGQFAVEARAAPGCADRDHGKQLVARSCYEKLKLRVLVARSERAKRRRAPAVLAEALGPQLNVPTAETLEPVRIGHQNGNCLALRTERDIERGALRR